MDDRDRELLATYRGEAASYFAVNQAGRTAAERTLALFFTVVAIAVAAGINAASADVALPLPPLAMLLFAYMCNQFSDLTVLGMARAELEERANGLFGEDALIYELVVAPIRKHRPLSSGVRVLQGLSLAVLLGVVVVGTGVAFVDQPTWVTVVYCAATTLSTVAAAVAYKAMRDTPEVATREIQATLASREAARNSS